MYMPCLEVILPTIRLQNIVSFPKSFVIFTFSPRVEPVQVGLPSLRRAATEHVDALADDHRAVEGSRRGNVAICLDLGPRLGVCVKHPEVVE